MLYNLLAKLLAKECVFNWLYKKATKTPYTHIINVDNDNAEVYMERYWLFNPYHETKGLKQLSWLPISIRLHHILKPDMDRHLHDHPWNARTFILKGSYIEKRKEGLYRRVCGTTAELKYGEYHKIVNVSDGGVYTLFITGKYRGTWGFLVNGVKVKWR